MVQFTKIAQYSEIQKKLHNMEFLKNYRIGKIPKQLQNMVKFPKNQWHNMI